MGEASGPLRTIAALSRNPSQGHVSVSLCISKEELYELLDLKGFTTRIDNNSCEITETKQAQKSLEDRITKLEIIANNHDELLKRVADLENKWDSIIHLIHAIHYLYQYWDYFLMFQKACACKTFSDIANMSADQAHKMCIEYNRKEKCIHGSVRMEAITRSIETAGYFTSMN